jgi:hypothetical protein
MYVQYIPTYPVPRELGGPCQGKHASLDTLHGAAAEWCSVFPNPKHWFQELADGVMEWILRDQNRHIELASER